MSQSRIALKTTRAFRTISEAGEELDLQPHVLRFWESKFPQIKPIKRGGGRRFYRPDDIEFLRGIKILLHDEKHSIKDVQKLIQKKGASRITDLGRSIEKAALDKKVTDTDLLPERIIPGEGVTKSKPKKSKKKTRIAPVEVPTPEADMPPVVQAVPEPPVEVVSKVEVPAPVTAPAPEPGSAYWPVQDVDMDALREALTRLETLKAKWVDFRDSSKDS